MGGPYDNGWGNNQGGQGGYNQGGYNQAGYNNNYPPQGGRYDNYGNNAGYQYGPKN